MNYTENEILKFIDPVLKFCIKRLTSHHDAEDLASEIILYVLDGLNKYDITSLEGWVWQIAHNRYARFIKKRNNSLEIIYDEELFNIGDDYSFVDRLVLETEYQEIFKLIHTLSSEYKDILVDYYIGEMPVKAICLKYSLTESTVKWRLNASRQKIKSRIGENNMDKIYKRINWNTTSCNGSMDSNQYLYSQITRAICEAAYEKPLTIEEITHATGIPTMYIEDELPRLIGGDALIQKGNKYATNFIILRMCDKNSIKKLLLPLISDIASYFKFLFSTNELLVKNIGFYGSDFGLKRLGYIIIPAILRHKISQIKDTLNIPSGHYPPRKDGGYGWFIVEETETEEENRSEYASGCNISGIEEDNIYYHWTQKYFNNNIYHNGGTRWLASEKIPQKSNGGIIPDHLLDEQSIIRLLSMNLIIKSNNGYNLNFAMFTQDEYIQFMSLFNNTDEQINIYLSDLIRSIHRSFKEFVPKRLDSQINQWVSCYTHEIVGMVCEELINTDILERPHDEKPLTNGVFYVSGKYINP